MGLDWILASGLQKHSDSHFGKFAWSKISSDRQSGLCCLTRTDLGFHVDKAEVVEDEEDLVLGTLRRNQNLFFAPLCTSQQGIDVGRVCDRRLHR